MAAKLGRKQDGVTRPVLYTDTGGMPRALAGVSAVNKPATDGGRKSESPKKFIQTASPPACLCCVLTIRRFYEVPIVVASGHTLHTRANNTSLEIGKISSTALPLPEATATVWKDWR